MQSSKDTSGPSHADPHSRASIHPEELMKNLAQETACFEEESVLNKMPANEIESDVQAGDLGKGSSDDIQSEEELYPDQNELSNEENSGEGIYPENDMPSARQNVEEGSRNRGASGVA